MIIVICLVLGLVLGLFVPLYIPPDFAPYVGIAIFAALDSVFGALVASLHKNFDLNIFSTGFLANTILAVLLTYAGKALGINIEIAVLIVFTMRLLQNFALIRRFLLNKYAKKDTIR